jgi:hypothetical protein
VAPLGDVAEDFGKFTDKLVIPDGASVLNVQLNDVWPHSDA